MLGLRILLIVVGKKGIFDDFGLFLVVCLLVYTYYLRTFLHISNIFIMLNISILVVWCSYFFLLLRSRVYSYIKKKLYLCNENDTRKRMIKRKNYYLKYQILKIHLPKIYFI